MSTFLELCRDYRSELGIPGLGPVTVTNQIGELARVVTDIREADMDIQRQWQDWKFLWNVHSTKTVADSAWLETQKPADLGTWNTNTCFLDKGTDDYVRLDYIDYDAWSGDQAVGMVFNDKPYEFTVLPDGTIRLFPTPNSTVYSFTGEYWRKALPMVADEDISRVPEEYHRAIVVRAKIIYAEREDAPEIMAGATAEYESLMTNLEAAYLQNQGDGRQARVIRPRVVVVE